MKHALPFWNTPKQQIKSEISAPMHVKNKLGRNVSYSKCISSYLCFYGVENEIYHR